MACHISRRRNPLLPVILLSFIGLAITPALGQSQSHVGNYHFRLEIAGVDAGMFANVEGLSIEQEVIEFREGGDIGVIRKVPGPIRYGDITLKRGYVHDDAFSEWVWSSLDPTSEVDRRNGTIIMMDQKGREVARWHFTNGWPSKWTGPSPKQDGNDVAIEMITIAVESIDKG